MSVSQFQGFAGVVLRGERQGDPEDPLVLLVHGLGQTREIWRDIAASLVRAGRQVMAIDLRGHGESDWPADARYDFAAYVEDLRAVLAQLPCRPVIIGASLGGWAAAAAVGEDGAHLVSGLVLTGAPPGPDLASLCQTAGVIGGACETARGAWDPRLPEGFVPGQARGRFRAAVPNIRVPALLVRSDINDADATSRMADEIPGAEYAGLGEAGHPVPPDPSDRFSAALIDFMDRRVPRRVPEYRPGAEARRLRDALGCFATGVTVVTAFEENGDPVGLTANSFTSVSLDPPLLLVCIARSSGSLKALEKAGHFGVNVLHIGQQPVSQLFSKPGEDRFAQIAWMRGVHDAPLLPGALASFECRRHQLYDGGDHIILVGEVVRAVSDPRRDPLLYFRGSYRRLQVT